MCVRVDVGQVTISDATVHNIEHSDDHDEFGTSENSRKHEGSEENADLQQ